MNEARDLATRVADTRRTLHDEVDCWVATAHPAGGPPALVPLSFEWDGQTLLIVTARTTPAGRNMRASGVARIAVGSVRDVVMIEADVTEHELDEISENRWSAYLDQVGSDARTWGDDYVAYEAHPVTIQAWREANETSGRTIMREGRWLDA